MEKPEKKVVPEHEKLAQRMIKGAYTDWLLNQYAKRIKESEKPKIPENGINAKELKEKVAQYGWSLFNKIAKKHQPIAGASIRRMQLEIFENADDVVNNLPKDASTNDIKERKEYFAYLLNKFINNRSAGDSFDGWRDTKDLMAEMEAKKKK